MAESPAQLHAEIEKYQQKHAETPEGRYFVPLANAHRKLGEFDRAESLLREGLRRHPDYLSAHIVLGRTLADSGAAADAIAEFRHVLGIDPQNLIALRSLGELAAAAGSEDEAGHWYRELLAVDPMNDEARQALADLEGESAVEEEPQVFESSTPWWQSPPQSEAPDPGTLEEPAGDTLGAPAPLAAADNSSWSLQANPDDQIAAPDETTDDQATDDSLGLMDWSPSPQLGSASDEEEEVGTPSELDRQTWQESDFAGIDDRDAFPLPASASADALPEPDVQEVEPISFESTTPEPELSTPEVEPSSLEAEIILPETDRAEEPTIAEWMSSEAPKLDAGDEEPGWNGSGEVEETLPEFGRHLSAEPEQPDLEDGESLDSAFGEDDQLVTETMAELYAAQGFHEEAIDVYRELIRRRGEEPALMRRLSQLEADAEAIDEIADEFTDEPAGELADETADDRAADSVTETVLQTASDTIAETVAVEALADGGDHEDDSDLSGAPAAAGEEDQFADSFGSGFPGAEIVGEADTGESDVEQAPEEQELAYYSGADDIAFNGDLPGVEVAEEMAEAQPEIVDAPSQEEVLAEEAGGPERGADLPVSQYFAGLLAWRPARTGRYDALASVSPPTVQDPELEVEPGNGSLDEPPYDVEFAEAEPIQSSSGDLEPSPELDGPLSGRNEQQLVDDEDLFPWELPPQSSFPEAKHRETERADDSAHERLESGSRNVEAVTPPVSPDAEPEPSTSVGPTLASSKMGEEDDEDLESFQAWLRSLKR